MGAQPTQNVYEALLAAQRAKAAADEQAASAPGIVSRALDTINIPFSTVMGGIHAAVSGGDVAETMGAALAGEKQYDMTDLLVDAGADPNSAYTKWGGLALDIFPGGFLDPLTPFTLGANKLGKAAKIAGKFPTRLMDTGNLARVAEDVPDLVKAAREGLWAPNYLGVPLAPRKVSEYMAKAVQGAGDYIKGRTAPGEAMSTVQKVTSGPYRTLRPLIGGRTKTYENYFQDLPGLKKQVSEESQQALDQIESVYNSKSPETRQLMTYFKEQPILMERALAGDKRVAYAVPKDMTQEEWLAFLKESLPYAKADMTPDEAYRASALSVLPDLGRTLMNNPVRKVEAVRLSQLSNFFPGGTDIREVTDNLLQSPELRDMVAKHLGPDYSFEAIVPHHALGDAGTNPEKTLLWYLNKTKTPEGRTSTNGTPWLSADQLLTGKTKDPVILVSRPNALDQVPPPLRKDREMTLKIFEKLADFSARGGNLRDWNAVKQLSKSPKLKTVWDAMNDAIYEKSAQELGGKTWGKYASLGKQWNLLRAHGDKALEWQWKHDTLQGLIDEKVAELDRLNLPTAPDAPFSIVDNERKMKLVEELDALRAEQRDPGLFGKAAKLRETIAKQSRPDTVGNKTEERILELGAYSPEIVADAARTIEELKPVFDTLDKGWSSRGIRFGRDQETYLQHFPKGLAQTVYNPGEGALERAAKAEQFKAAMTERIAMESPWLSPEEVAKRAEIEVSKNRSIFARNSVGTGEYDSLVHRREHDVPILVYNAIHPDKPFETDIGKILGEEYRIASNYWWGFDAYQHLIKNYAGKFARKIDDPGAVPQGWTKITYHIPFGNKNPFENWYVPKDLQDVMHGGMRAIKELSTDEGTKRAFEILHGARRWWSAFTLAPFPAYHIRNLFGNITFAQMAGVDLRTPLGWKAWTAGFGAVAEKKGEAALQSWADMLNAAYKTNQFTTESLRSVMKASSVIGVGLRDLDWQNHGDEIAAILQKGMDKQTKTKELLRFVHPDHRKNKLVEMGFGIGRKNEDMARATVFLHRLMTNATSTQDIERAIKEATSHAKKYMLDYGDLTPFEQNWMKLFAPFYTFSAKTVPLMAGEFIRNPGKFQYLNRAYHGAWSGYDEELEPEDLPDWMRQDMRIPLAKSGNDYVMFSGKNWFPASELMEVAQSFTNMDSFAQYWIGKMSPILKDAFEIALNKNAFTGEPINEPGKVNDMFGMFTLPGWGKHVLENLRALNELDRANPGGLWTTLGKMRGLWQDERPHRQEAPGVYRALQVGTGLNFKDVEPVESLRKQLMRKQREINEMRADIRYAVRRGQWAERDKKMAVMADLVNQQRTLSERLSERQRYTAAHLKQNG